MPRGRKRRLKNFGKRAQAFASETRQLKPLYRDGRLIVVGTGTHSRLIQKPKASQAFTAKKIEGELFEAFTEKKLVPRNYQLVSVSLSERQANPAGAKVAIQEYFHKPSVRSLLYYLEALKAKPKDFSKYLGPAEEILCKRFANQNKQLSYATLNTAFGELQRHSSYFFYEEISASNVIVLGTTRDGRLRLAIVDV